MISDDQKEEVKARADIVDVIGEYVQLKKAGREFKARCPFHDERTPSFYVVPDKQMYHCFGCDASGDVFSFLQAHAGMDFMESLRFLAARTGVELRESQPDPEMDAETRRREDANSFAQAWFQRHLEDPEQGTRARDYLDRRGINAETREAFGMGWAPEGWRGLRDAAAAHGLDDHLMVEMGLLTRGSSGPTADPFDMFRGRVMFPIRSSRGKVVAFGGRILGDGKPKYINTSETPIYTKGQHLYGFDRSGGSIRREKVALLVEGYMDLVSLAAGGITNVVASLGTALTPEQAEILRRTRARVLILYDSDSAGLRATFKVADVLLAAGVQPFAVTLPPGEDPDTLVQGQGAEALQLCLSDAIDIVDLKVKILAERGRFASASGKRDALDRLLPTLRATADPMLRDIYIGQVAGRVGVRIATIEEELAREPSAAPRPFRRAQPQTPDEEAAAPPSVSASRILRILARDRARRHEHLTSILEVIGPEDFKNSAQRFIFQSFVDDPDLSGPQPGTDPAVARLLGELLAEVADPDELASAGRVLRESTSRLAEDRLYDQMTRVQRAMESTDDAEEKIRLLREKSRLREEASAIGIRWAPALKKYAQGLNEPSR